MAKITLSDIDNESVPSASATINSNNQDIEDALENTLSRDGTSPNQMESNLDINGYRILNHPDARGSTYLSDLVTVGDLAVLGIPGPKGPKGDSGDGSGDVLASNNLSDLDNASTARTNLGLEIDADVLAFDQTLQDIVDLTWNATEFLRKDGSGDVDAVSPSSLGSDLFFTASESAARTSLGLGDCATLDVGTAASTVAAGDDSRFTSFSIVTRNTTTNFAITDAGKLIRHTSASAHTFTLNPFATTAIPVGTVIAVRNDVSGGDITIARGSGVALYVSGGTSNANVTVSAGGFASLTHEASNQWVISGSGLS